jgi:hypothetical protein
VTSRPACRDEDRAGAPDGRGNGKDDLDAVSGPKVAGAQLAAFTRHAAAFLASDAESAVF